ncbi:hypothetical protein EVAR_72149_1 [Eumeta japonica]|uniref:Uncharacterized protein n=1 Tax=Eumeta variegata TaxID=151549 RepID=A0A4C1T5J6_EUMVA|nr:hypothetical protein EVAR_72149_1 [Eumeta japonica]
MLGPQWEGATPLLRCFAIAGALTTLSFVGYWVYVSRGLSRQLLQYSLVSTGIRAACILVGSFFGVVGIGIGFAVAPAIAWPLSIWWLSRITTLPVRALYTGALRMLTVSAVAALTAWAASTAACLSRVLGSRSAQDSRRRARHWPLTARSRDPPRRTHAHRLRSAHAAPVGRGALAAVRDSVCHAEWKESRRLLRNGER